MANRSELGKRLKARRKALDISANDLAKECGLTAATIYRVESGEIGQLKSAALIRLAEALHTTTDYLMGKTEEPKLRDVLTGDKIAQYIYSLYDQMTAPQIRDLIRFAEFIRNYPATLNDRYRQLLDEHRALFHFTEWLIEKHDLDDRDPAYKAAEKRFADMVLNGAQGEVNAEDDNELNKRNNR